MAVTVVQKVSGNVVSGASTVHAVLATTTTGNTLVAFVAPWTGAANRTVSSWASSAGTATFAKIIAQVGIVGTYPGCEYWVAPNITGGTTPTITATISGTMTAGDIYIYELAGMPTTTTQDGTAAGVAGTSATACTAPAITTTGSNTIIFAGFSPSQAMSALEASWTGFIVSTGGGNTVDSASEYIIETSPKTALVPTATQGPTGTYGALTMALKGTGASTVLPTAIGACIGSAVLKVRLRPKAIGAAAGVAAMFAPKRPTAFATSTVVVTTFNIRYVFRPMVAATSIGTASAHGNLRQTAFVTSSGSVAPHILELPKASASSSGVGTIQVRIRPQTSGVVSGSAAEITRLVERPRSAGSCAGVAAITIRIRDLVSGACNGSAALVNRSVFRPGVTSAATGSSTVPFKYTDRPLAIVAGASTAIAGDRTIDRPILSASSLATSVVAIPHQLSEPTAIGSASGVGAASLRTAERPKAIGGALSSAVSSDRLIARPLPFVSCVGKASIVIRVVQLAIGATVSAAVVIPEIRFLPKAIGAAIGTESITARPVSRAVTVGSTTGIASQGTRFVKEPTGSGTSISSSAVTVRFYCRPQAIGTSFSNSGTTQQIGGLYRPIALGAANLVAIVSVRVRYFPRGASFGSGVISVKLTPIRPTALAPATATGVVIPRLVYRPARPGSAVVTASVTARIYARPIPFVTVTGTGSVTERLIARPISAVSAVSSGVTIEELGGTSRPRAFGNAQVVASIVARIRTATSSTAVSSSSISTHQISGPKAIGSVVTVAATTVRIGGNIHETVLGAASATVGVVLFKVRAPLASTCSGVGAVSIRLFCLPQAVARASVSGLTGEVGKVGVLRPVTVGRSSCLAAVNSRTVLRPISSAISLGSGLAAARSTSRTQALAACLGSGQTLAAIRVGISRPSASGTSASSVAQLVRLTRRIVSSGISRSSGETIGRSPLFPTAIGVSGGTGYTGELNKVGVLRSMTIASASSISLVFVRLTLKSVAVGDVTGSGTATARRAARPTSIATASGMGVELRSGGILAQRFSAISSCISAASISVRLFCRPSPSGNVFGTGKINYEYLYFPTANGSTESSGSYNGGPNQRITLMAGAITMSMVATPLPAQEETITADSFSGGSVFFETVQTITGGGNSARTATVVLGTTPVVINLSRGSGSEVFE